MFESFPACVTVVDDIFHYLIVLLIVIDVELGRKAVLKGFHVVLKISPSLKIEVMHGKGVALFGKHVTDKTAVIV